MDIMYQSVSDIIGGSTSVVVGGDMSDVKSHQTALNANI
jgi:hypothetical protein